MSSANLATMMSPLACVHFWAACERVPSRTHIANGTSESVLRFWRLVIELFAECLESESGVFPANASALIGLQAYKEG